MSRYRLAVLKSGFIRFHLVSKRHTTLSVVKNDLVSYGRCNKFPRKWSLSCLLLSPITPDATRIPIISSWLIPMFNKTLKCLLGSLSYRFSCLPRSSSYSKSRITITYPEILPAMTDCVVSSSVSSSNRTCSRTLSNDPNFLVSLHMAGDIKKHRVSHCLSAFTSLAGYLIPRF